MPCIIEMHDEFMDSCMLACMECALEDVAWCHVELARIHAKLAWC